MTALTTILAGMADATWQKVNLNTFPDAWPPIADRTTAGSPLSVVGAWSSFEWDSLRQQLMLFGGGHGNYAGNELYLWNGTSLAWSLGTLPSKVVGVTIYVLRAIGGTAASTTVGNTSGALYSAGLFSGGDRTVANGDTLQVTYTASL